MAYLTLEQGSEGLPLLTLNMINNFAGIFTEAANLLIEV